MAISRNGVSDRFRAACDDKPKHFQSNNCKFVVNGSACSCIIRYCHRYLSCSEYLQARCFQVVGLVFVLCLLSCSNSFADINALGSWGVSCHRSGVESAVGLSGPAYTSAVGYYGWGLPLANVVTTLDVDITERVEFPGTYDVVVGSRNTVVVDEYYFYQGKTYYSGTLLHDSGDYLNTEFYSSSVSKSYILVGSEPLDVEIILRIYPYKLKGKTSGTFREAHINLPVRIYVLEGGLSSGDWLGDGTWAPVPDDFSGSGPGQPLYTVPVPDDPDDAASYWENYWDWLAGLFVPSQDRVVALRRSLDDLRGAGIFGFVARCATAFRNPTGQYAQDIVVKSWNLEVGAGDNVHVASVGASFDKEFIRPSAMLPGYIQSGDWFPLYTAAVNLGDVRHACRRIISFAMWLMWCGGLVSWLVGKWRN